MEKREDSERRGSVGTLGKVKESVNTHAKKITIGIFVVVFFVLIVVL